MYGPAAYPNETASRNVKMGIRFWQTAVNKGDVNDNPARNSCCEPTILHHTTTTTHRVSILNSLAAL
jgi:hypothetical protein